MPGRPDGRETARFRGCGTRSAGNCFTCLERSPVRCSCCRWSEKIAPVRLGQGCSPQVGSARSSALCRRSCRRRSDERRLTAAQSPNRPSRRRCCFLIERRGAALRPEHCGFAKGGLSETGSAVVSGVPAIAPSPGHCAAPLTRGFRRRARSGARSRHRRLRARTERVWRPPLPAS